MATALGSAPPTLLRNASASPPAHSFSFGVLGLCCCVSFSVVVASWGYSLVACGLLIAVASRRGARALGHPGFRGWGTRARGHRLSSCARGPNGSAACAVLLDQGSNPRLLHGQADSLPLNHQGGPLFSLRKPGK